jgi:hypothetical protein
MGIAALNPPYLAFLLEEQLTVAELLQYGHRSAKARFDNLYCASRWLEFTAPAQDASMKQSTVVDMRSKRKIACGHWLNGVVWLMTTICLSSCEKRLDEQCANSEKEEGVCLVSLNTLSQDPAAYDGRLVELSGFPDKTFSDKVSYILYPTRDSRGMQEPGGLAVYFSIADAQAVEDRRRRSKDAFDAIWVIGTFNASKNKAKLLGTIRNAKLEAIQ